MTPKTPIQVQCFLISLFFPPSSPQLQPTLPPFTTSHHPSPLLVIPTPVPSVPIPPINTPQSPHTPVLLTFQPQHIITFSLFRLQLPLSLPPFTTSHHPSSLLVIHTPGPSVPIYPINTLQSPHTLTLLTHKPQHIITFSPKFTSTSTHSPSLHHQPPSLTLVSHTHP